MHAVLMPDALDVKPVRIAAAAAVTNAFRCGGVLQGGVEPGHTVVILKSVNQTVGF
jgi:hypothetical protein